METREILLTVHIRKEPEKGQARRRVSFRRWFAGLNVRAVVWYVFLELVGIMLYEVGAAYALRQRGYFAVGGAALALLLPVFYYIAAATIWDIVQDMKGGR